MKSLLHCSSVSRCRPRYPPVTSAHRVDILQCRVIVVDVRSHQRKWSGLVESSRSFSCWSHEMLRGRMTTPKAEPAARQIRMSERMEGITSRMCRSVEEGTRSKHVLYMTGPKRRKQMRTGQRMSIKPRSGGFGKVCGWGG